EALALGCPGPVLLQHIPQDLGDLGGLADLPAVGAADLMAVRSGDDDGADVLTPHAGEEDGVPGLRDGLGPVRTLVLPGKAGDLGSECAALVGGHVSPPARIVGSARRAAARGGSTL